MLQRVLRSFLWSVLLGGGIAGVFLAFAFLFHVVSGHGPSPLFIVPFFLFFYVVAFFLVSLFLESKKSLTRLFAVFVTLHVCGSLVLHPSTPVPIVQVVDSVEYFVKYRSIAYTDVYASWRKPVLKAAALAKYESQIPERGVQVFYYFKDGRTPYSYFLEARAQPMNRDGGKTFHDRKARVYVETNNLNVEFELRQDGPHVKDTYQGTDVTFSLPKFLYGAPASGTGLGRFKDLHAILDYEDFWVRSRYASWAGKLIHLLRG